ncbi:thermonuclease family protein [Sphingomonas rhizophila]|uniref:Thermonuclease family protein n=1 Tax=Sphingomonas rhizophila TaxID=2071607 RepID=A0A7G9S9Z4_9SPHN|nr:thermonuclease family protein [Sphingomonas rhizophila]QNN64669.1 thermonuclease family protein [Sphingomonas rhizophila]
MALLAVAGASLDPAIVAPFGPLASQPERVEANFTRCGRGRGFACVVDGDTVRLGGRRVRIVGIDAPEIVHPQCPGEAALGQRAADRLVVLLNRGPFDMTAHRFNRTDKYGRDLMLLTRGETSIGQSLIDEGLAHRYLGMKRGWC